MKALEIILAKPMDMQSILSCKGGMHCLMAGLSSIGHPHGEAGLSFELGVSADGSVKQNLLEKNVT